MITSYYERGTGNTILNVLLLFEINNYIFENKYFNLNLWYNLKINTGLY